jgi:spermidine synthase
VSLEHPVRQRRLFPAIFLQSAVGIAYEIALTRVFSIGQWHHFAYMIISMAMLGFAASGAVLGLLRERVRGFETEIFRAAALLVPVSLVACYTVSQQIPFETLELASQPRQIGYLLLLYIVLAVPFFTVSTCIAVAFLLEPRRVGRVYFFSMLGSGIGAATIVGLMFAAPVAALPYFLAAAAAVAFLFSSLNARAWLAGGLAILIGAAALVAAFGTTPVRISEYKGLSYALRLPDAKVVVRARSPLSELTAVSSELIRETPGQISGYAMSEHGALPEQIGLYFDGGAVSPVHRFDGSLAPFAFLDYVTSALPYQLVARPRVLVIGAGGGTEVLNGLLHGAIGVTALEVDPSVVSVVSEALSGFSGGLYRRSDVRVVVAEGRGFLESHPDSYDVIQIALLDSFSTSAAGLYALSESYLYTREAVALYLDRLSERGVLSITRWLKTPPRDAIKLFATAVEALEASGAEAPWQHLVFIRSWNTATVVVSRSPLTESQVRSIRDFAEARGFDRVFHPGIDETEANRYTVLDQAIYYRTARQILFGERQRLFRDYPFYVVPATDGRPYFFRFFKWRSLPALLDALGRDVVNFLEWGYLILALTVVQAALASLAFVLLPLGLFGNRASGGRGWTVLYFGGLGLSYMFLEIAFIQRFMLFLAYPLYAVAVVLTAFLLFSGLGSLFADRRSGGRGAVMPAARLVGLAVAGITASVALYAVVLPTVFGASAAWPDAWKIVISLLLLAPLAFLMGIPFPAGLQLVSDRRDLLVPWAWGVNGATSVVGAALAALAAVHIGFGGVIAIAVAVYIGCFLALRRLAV